jgi:hypothetical protein
VNHLLVTYEGSYGLRDEDVERYGCGIFPCGHCTKFVGDIAGNTTVYHNVIGRHCHVFREPRDSFAKWMDDIKWPERFL